MTRADPSPHHSAWNGAPPLKFPARGRVLPNPSPRNDFGRSSGGTSVCLAHSHRPSRKGPVVPPGKTPCSQPGRATGAVQPVNLQTRSVQPQSARAAPTLLPGPHQRHSNTSIRLTSSMHDCHAGIRNARVSLPLFQRPHLPEATVFLHGHSLAVRSPEPSHIQTNERGARP